mmetsp:Transcript_26044/g.46202  ORF Transcript_26044/g.46202 Transcript_26044/m.46202 type:complete len:90 (+) Transcript_26044:39-308(+)
MILTASFDFLLDSKGTANDCRRDSGSPGISGLFTTNSDCLRDLGDKARSEGHRDSTNDEKPTLTDWLPLSLLLLVCDEDAAVQPESVPG